MAMDNIIGPDDNNRRANSIIAVTTTLTAIGTASYLARIYTRAILLKNWYLEDWLLTLGWIFGVAYVCLICVGTAFGDGHHVWNVTPAEFVVNLKLQLASSYLYSSTMGFCKLGICRFYMRIFDHSVTINLAMAWIAINFLGQILFTSLFCQPMSAYWTLSTYTLGGDSTKCVNILIPFYTFATANICADIWLMAIVFPKVYALRMPRRQKIILLGIVSLGWFIVIAAVYRIVRISKILESQDGTWDAFDARISSAVDVNVSIVCASIPVTRPLLRKCVPRLGRWLNPMRPSQQSTSENQTSSGSQGKRLGKSQKLPKLNRLVACETIGGSRSEGYGPYNQPQGNLDFLDDDFDERFFNFRCTQRATDLARAAEEDPERQRNPSYGGSTTFGDSTSSRAVSLEQTNTQNNSIEEKV